jgi:endonuclease YncB( thermonuclease family)
VLDDRLAYLHAQENAEKEQLGLWVEPKPTAPWDFRRSIKYPKNL